MNIVNEFVDSTLRKAARRALTFWYKNYIGDSDLLDFLRRCTWRREKTGFKVIYRGPEPKEK
jgi:hypothetical protein